MLKISMSIMTLIIILILSFVFDNKKKTFYNAGKLISDKQSLHKQNNKPIPQKLQWKIPFKN